MELVSVSDLQVAFPTDRGLVKAVNRVDLSLQKGDVFGLLGESGSGKTVLGSAIMRLLPDNIRLSGSITYDGKDIMALSKKELRNMRGKELGMILQNPSSALNPSLTIGSQIAEVFMQHNRLNKKQAYQKTVELLEKVQILHAEQRIKEYPHQFSGGMKERVIIAMGIASNPNFIIADEPTKGLDMIVKQSIVELLKKIASDKTMLMITHDLEVAQEISTHIGIMYCGELVEVASTQLFFEEQLHPYTKGFFSSMPSRGLKPILGQSPSLIDVPQGCRFCDRCAYSTEKCKTEHPTMVNLENGRKVRCFLYAEG